MKLQKLTTAILLGIATLLLALGCETDSSSDDSSSSNDNPSPKPAITGTFRYDSLDINAQKDHSIQGNAVKWDDDAAANQTDNLEYSIAPDLPTGLTLNKATGEITGTPTNHIASKQYTVTAKGDEKKFSGIIDTTLYITVVDDTKTLIKGTFAYPNADIIGATTVDMTANSQDPIPTWNDNVAGQTVRYTITPALPEGLSFVAATGAITGTSKNPVPKTQYKVTAIVGGTYGGTYTTSINITITEKFPITETGATLSYDAILLKINVDIDASKEGSPIWEKKPQGMIASYSIAPTSLPDGLIFDPATGAITGTPSVVVLRKEYTITVTDTENLYQGSIESKVSIEVTDKTPITGNFTYNNEADVQIIKNNTAVNFDPTWESAAQDQLDNLQYSIAPSIPNVITINANTGVISVTPTQALKKKDYTVTATGTGNFGGSLTSVINIEILNPPITGTFTYQNIIFAKENTDGLTGAVPNWTDQAADQLDNLHYSVAPPLPAGLEINKDTGEISGTPTQASERQPYTITATGINIFSGEETFDIYITITAYIDGTLSYEEIIHKRDVEISVRPQWKDVSEEEKQSANLEYRIETTLPDGLEINKDTGEISGTPTKASKKQEYTVKAKGINIFSGEKTFGISITITAQIDGTLSYQVNRTLNQEIQTSPTWTARSDEDQVLTYSVDPTSPLPTGLLLNTITGEITGTSATLVDTTATIIATGVAPYQGTIEGTASIKIIEISVSFSYTSIAEGASDTISPTFVGEGITAADGDFSIVASGTGTVIATAPTIDTDNGDITVTNTTTAGTYMVTFTLDNSIQVTVPFYVTITPNDSVAELVTALQTGIGHFGLDADFNYIQTSALTSMQGVFSNIANFNGDISKWNVANVINMANMFKNASKFNGDISGWTVDNVENMASMFQSAVAFNGDISGWTVDNVENMASMFQDANVFNGDISGWTVDNVENMASMFQDANVFNGDISKWNVANVTDMNNMFYDAIEFTGDISGWTVDNVTNMSFMFASESPSNPSKFNGDISGWTVDNVKNMASMFQNAKTFNKDLNGWNVKNVTNMSGMFQQASKFNGDISSWTVDNVTNMSFMFRAAIKFNSDISGWNVENVTNMSYLFQSSITSTFDRPIGNWDVSGVTDMSYMFHGAIAFNQPIGDWDVSNVTNMQAMFRDATTFDRPIGNWDVSRGPNTGSMFHTASSFNQPLGNWDVSSMNNMDVMFYQATLFNQDITTWNVAHTPTKPTNFSDSSALATDNMPNWGTGIVVANFDGTLAEGGSSTFTVTLSTLPTEDVIIDLTSSDPGEGALSPVQITFPAKNDDDKEQTNPIITITLTSPTDNVDDGDQSYTVTVAVNASTSDPVYGNKAPRTFSAVTTD